MKKTRILTFVMALAVLCSMLFANTTVFAASEDTVTLTIDNKPAESGISIINKTYKAYRVFNAEVTGATVSYSVSTKYQNFFSEELIDGDGNTYDFTGLTAGTVAYNSLALQYVRAYEDDIDSLVEKLQYYIDDEGASFAADAVISDFEYNEITGYEVGYNTNMHYGYYLIVDSDIADSVGKDTTASILHTITSETTIDIKGSAPTVDKEIYHNETDSWGTTGDNQIGDIVEFKLTSTIPQDLASYDSYVYQLVDTISAGLEYDTTSIAIYTDPDLATPLDNEYYTLADVDNAYVPYTTVDAMGATTTSDDSFTFVKTDGTIFVINVDIMQLMADGVDFDTLYITYEAELTEDAAVATSNNHNTISLEYSNNPYAEYRTNTITDKVYEFTFDLDVTKTAEDGSTPLADAVFALYEVNPDGSEVQIALLPTGVTNEYYTDADATATDTDGASSTNVIVTDETGLYNIKGLDDATNYVLREIEAPEGYNAVSGIKFMITATYTTTGEQVLSLVTDNSDISTTIDGLSTKIINTSGALLPSTGGMGTTIIYIVGGVIMLGGVLLVLSKVKKTRENN